MVVLDEDGVVQTEAMVRGAADPDRVFLEHPQARSRLPGADHSRVSRFANHPNEVPCGGGNAGEMPEKVERGALGRQERASGTLELGQDRTGFDVGAVAVLDLVPHAPEQPEREDRAVQPADPPLVTSHNPGRGLHVILDDRAGRDVAYRTKVHRQLAPDEILILDQRERCD